MALIYITGSPGSGKSTICSELQNRGFTAYDEYGFSGWFNKSTGKLVPHIPDNRTADWYQSHVYKFVYDNVRQLADEAQKDRVFLCSQTFYDDEVWDMFDKIIFLTIDPVTLTHRLQTRSGTTYGKNPAELDYILRKYPLLKQSRQQHGAIMVDATRPLTEIVDEIVHKTTA
jgi:dephospho-CoA kinase